MKEVRLSIFGFGNVGKAVARVILEKGKAFEEQYGIRLKAVSVSDSSATVWLPEGVDLGEALNIKEHLGRLSEWKNDYEVYDLTPKEAAREVEAEVVIDVTNDKNAWEWHVEALKAGRAVVTSNKPPLAFHYSEIMEEAQRRNLPYLFEATVMAGTPIVGLLRENLLGDHVHRIDAVLNGTTTYILTRMEEGESFEDALREAQGLGIAERDPSGDILGIDAGYKATILHCISFGPITFDEIHVEGIAGMGPKNMMQAKREGETIRLVATIEEDQVRVRPKRIPQSSPLAVSSTQNAALIKTDLLGELAIKGAGAGLKETASGVVSDIIKASMELRF